MEIPYREFTICPATNAHIPSIKRAVFGVLEEYGLKGNESGKDKDLSDLVQHYFSRNGYFGVVMDSATQEIVGTFGLYPLGDTSCELRKMYLLKRARGKGVGEFILKYAIQLAKEMGYSKMVLETISPLKEAISLYKKHGFREVAPKEVSDRVDQAFELSLE